MFACTSLHVHVVATRRACRVYNYMFYTKYARHCCQLGEGQRCRYKRSPPRAHGAQKGLIVPHAHWRDLECLVVKRFSLIINASGPTAGLISSQIKYLATRAFSV